MALRASFFSSFLFLALLFSSATSRPVSVPASESHPGQDLRARLKLLDDPEAPSCWNSVFELQACTAEIITFFMTGETQLGEGCCDAIKIIEKECWPGLMGTLGFTQEEGDVLEGYCTRAWEPDV